MNRKVPIHERFRKISIIIKDIRGDVTLLNSRINNLQDEVNTISKYLAEVSKIAQDNLLPKYRRIKFKKIEMRQND